MITLISSIVGLISGFLPSIIKIFEKRQDYRYELELTKLKIDSVKSNLQITKEIEANKNNTAEEESVRSHDTAISTDNSLIGNLKDSVRPVITYFFFFFFVGVKVAVAYVMFEKNMDPEKIINTVWDQNTMIIFSTIISFWFGSRLMEKIALTPPPLPKK